MELDNNERRGGEADGIKFDTNSPFVVLGHGGSCCHGGVMWWVVLLTINVLICDGHLVRPGS